MKILQAFADKGAENPCLDRYGDVYRVGWKAERNDYSMAIKGNAQDLPIDPDVAFDLGFFHPPCGGVSPMSDTGGGSRDDWPDLIPLSRELGKQYCEHYVIENKPRDSIDTEVTLNGFMFELGIKYERAFESTFLIEQPPNQNKIADTSPFYYSEWSKGEWASVKGTTLDFTKEHIAKNTIPAVYLDYIMKYYYRHTDAEDRPDYSTYNEDRKNEQREKENAAITEWTP